MAALQNDTYKTLERFARKPSAANYLAFKLFIDTQEMVITQRAINLRPFSKQQSQQIAKKRNTLLGANQTVIRKVPFIDANDFYERASRALGISRQKLDPAYKKASSDSGSK